MNKLIVAGASLALVFGLGMVTADNARAEGDTNYTRTAQDGDSMTTLARGLVADENKGQKLNLSNEARTYAETTIVQSTGPKEVNVGEDIIFKKSLVSETISSASKLSAEELLAWKPYSDLIDFGSATVAGANTSASTSETEGTTSSSDSAVEEAAKTAENAAKSKSSNWYWWPIGLITLGGLYYILGGKPGKDSE